jgi:hypothetical protein
VQVRLQWPVFVRECKAARATGPSSWTMAVSQHPVRVRPRMPNQGRRQKAEGRRGFSAPPPHSYFFLLTSSFPGNGGHDVTAALRPVTASVPVQVRLTSPLSTGRRIGLSLITREVAGSIPASG